MEKHLRGKSRSLGPAEWLSHLSGYELTDAGPEQWQGSGEKYWVLAVFRRKNSCDLLTEPMWGA